MPSNVPSVEKIRELLQLTPDGERRSSGEPDPEVYNLPTPASTPEPTPSKDLNHLGDDTNIMAEKLYSENTDYLPLCNPYINIHLDGEESQLTAGIHFAKGSFLGLCSGEWDFVHDPIYHLQKDKGYMISDIDVGKWAKYLEHGHALTKIKVTDSKEGAIVKQSQDRRGALTKYFVPLICKPTLSTAPQPTDGVDEDGKIKERPAWNPIHIAICARRRRWITAHGGKWNNHYRGKGKSPMNCELRDILMKDPIDPQKTRLGIGMFATKDISLDQELILDLPGPIKGYWMKSDQEAQPVEIPTVYLGGSSANGRASETRPAPPAKLPVAQKEADEGLEALGDVDTEELEDLEAFDFLKGLGPLRAVRAVPVGAKGNGENSDDEERSITAEDLEALDADELRDELTDELTDIRGKKRECQEPNKTTFAFDKRKCVPDIDLMKRDGDTARNDLHRWYWKQTNNYPGSGHGWKSNIWPPLNSDDNGDGEQIEKLLNFQVKRGRDDNSSPTSKPSSQYNFGPYVQIGTRELQARRDKTQPGVQPGVQPSLNFLELTEEVIFRPDCVPQSGERKQAAAILLG